MNEVGIPANDPGRGSRIEQVVAREMNRSRRLLWGYALLLIIPLGACGLYYEFGRTDAALVHNEVNSNIAPIKRIIEQTEPALAQVQQTSEQLKSQEARLETLSRNQQEVSAAVQAVPQKLQQIDAIQADLSGVAKRMASAEAANNDLRGGVAQISDRFASILQQQNQIQQNLKELYSRVDRVRPQNYDDQLRRQQELIDSLRNRINTLEKARSIDPRAIRPQ